MTILDPALEQIAKAQSGAFASRQAHTVGVSDLDVHRLVRDGIVTRVRRGAFVVSSALLGLSPEAGYAVKTRAVLLSRPEPSWASHHAALAISGLPLVSLDLDRFDLCARVKRENRSGSVVTHPLPRDERALIVGGVRAVSTETALAQTAARYGVRPALVAMDPALAGGLASRDGVALAAERLRLGARGAERVARTLALCDPKAESPGESLTRLLLTGLGLDVRSQVDIRDASGLIGRVDFLVGERIIVEFDGLVKYEGAAGRAALAREKAREDRLRAAGYEVVRLTWADLDRPERVAKLIRQAASRAGRRSVSPVVA